MSQFKRSDEVAEDWINTIITKVRENLYEMKDSKGQNRYASGTTSQEVLQDNTDPVNIGDRRIVITLQMPEHYKFIDQGVRGRSSTKPNTSRSPYQYTNRNPPLSAMREFMRNRRIVPRDNEGNRTKGNMNKRLNSIAYALQKSIYEKGFEGVPFYSTVVNDERILKLENEFIAAFDEDVADILEIRFKD